MRVVAKEKVSGSGAKSTRPYIYDQQMSFLKKVYRESSHIVDNITNTNDEPTNSRESETDINIDDRWETQTSTETTTKRKKNPVRNEIDNKMIKFLDEQMNPPEKKPRPNAEENPHVAFIKGLLPSLNKLDDDQTLEFQAGVINLLQKIKSQKRKSSDYNRREEYIPTPISSTPSPFSNASNVSYASNNSDLSYFDLWIGIFNVHENAWYFILKMEKYKFLWTLLKLSFYTLFKTFGDVIFFFYFFVRINNFISNKNTCWLF